MREPQHSVDRNPAPWRPALVTLGVLIAVAAGLAAALGLASCFLYVSLRLNPLHAGYWVWLDTALAWYDARLPNVGRRLVGSALFGVLVTFGVPGLGLYTLWERTGRRRLYGDARFANDADIRKAGL